MRVSFIILLHGLKAPPGGGQARYGSLIFIRAGCNREALFAPFPGLLRHSLKKGKHFFSPGIIGGEPSE